MDGIYVDDVILEREINVNIDMHNESGYLIQLNDLVENCTLVIDSMEQSNATNVKNCTKLVPVVVSMQEGQKCFTFFSNLFGNMYLELQNQMDFERSSYVEIVLKNKYLLSMIDSSGENFFNNSNKTENIQTGIFMAIHSPTTLTNIMEIDYHRISPSKLIKVRFIKTRIISQPPPYKTMCVNYPIISKQTNYSKLSTPINPQNYGTQGECFLYCLLSNTYLQSYKKNELCMNFYSIFTKEPILLEEKLLEEGLFNYSKNARIKFCTFRNKSYEEYSTTRSSCLSLCRKPCLEELYNIDNVDINNIDNEHSMIRVEWSTEPVVNIEHKIKMSKYTFFGNFGGQAHILLGISIIKIFKYILDWIETGNYMHKIKSWFVFSWFRSTN